MYKINKDIGLDIYTQLIIKTKNYKSTITRHK